MVRFALVLVLVLSAVSFAMPRSMDAAVSDTWRVLHVAFESTSASDDTDGDGVINTWNRNLLRTWEAETRCVDRTIQQWSKQRINVQSERVVIKTDLFIDSRNTGGNNRAEAPYPFAEAFEAQYGFENYDVIIVNHGFTQVLTIDGVAYSALTGGYAILNVYGTGTGCNGWFVGVAAHEFTHSVLALYSRMGYPVCWNIYEYLTWNTYPNPQEMILQNRFPDYYCGGYGVPPEAFAVSYMEYYS